MIWNEKHGACKAIFAMAALLCISGCTTQSVIALQDKPRSQDLVSRRAPRDNGFIAHGGYVKDNTNLMNVNASKPLMKKPSDDFDYAPDEKPDTVGAWLIYSFGGNAGDQNPANLAQLFSGPSEETEVTVVNKNTIMAKRAAAEAEQPQTLSEWFHSTFKSNRRSSTPNPLFSSISQVWNSDWQMGEGSAAPTPNASPIPAPARRAPKGNADFFTPVRFAQPHTLDEGSAEDASYGTQRIASAPIQTVSSEIIQGDGRAIYQHTRFAPAPATGQDNMRRRPKLNQVVAALPNRQTSADGMQPDEAPKVNLHKAVKAFKTIAGHYGVGQ